jgi:hypothetical protein
MTITGLVGTQTANSGGLSLSYEDSDATGFFASSNWTWSTGTMTLALQKDLAQNVQHCFAFTVQNQRSEQLTPQVIKLFSDGNLLPGGGQVLSPDTSNGKLMPLRVLRLEFLEFASQQEDNSPCALNRITMCFRPSVNIIGTCKNELSSFTNYGFPKIYISGLTGTKAPTGSSLTVADNDLLQPTTAFNTSATWSRAEGTLRLQVLKDINSGVTQCIYFTVRNPANGQAAPTISLVSEVFSPKPETGISPAAGCAQPKGCTLSVVNITLNASIEQSSPFPCSTNIITVSLLSSVPMRGYCNNLITVSGLCGASTADSTSLTVTASGGSKSALSGAWTRSSGILVVNLQNIIATNDTSSNITMNFELTNQECAQTSCQHAPSVTGTRYRFSGS